MSISPHDRKSSRLALCAMLMFAVSCGPSLGSYSDSLVYRLKNRGPVTLSTENPYLAGNLLLTRFMEASSEIKGFVEHKGAPAALEIQAGMFSPLLMYFYYPEVKESYSLEQSGDLWIIRGPETIEPDTMAKLAPFTRGQQGQPVLALKPGISAQEPLESAGRVSEGGEQPKANLNIAGTQPFTSSSVPGYKTQAKKPAPRPSTSAKDEALVNAIVKKTGTHPAELSPKGDLVHFVTYPGETLTLISRWYTLDRGNVGRLVRINRLSSPDKLSVGDEIIIPSYMIKNKNRLTEAALQEMKGSEVQPAR